MTISIFDNLLTKKQQESKNTTLLFTGMDSQTRCRDESWFNLYDREISYIINNIGFRDDNVFNVENGIFAIGDSFTMGLGQPYEDTWPCILEKKLNQRIIKLAGNGASNEWMLSIFNVIKKLNPKLIFIMLSYFHRSTTFNDDSVVHHSWENNEIYEKDMIHVMEEKLKNFIEYITTEAKKINTPVLFSGVPQFMNDMNKKSFAKFGLSDDNFIFYKRLNLLMPIKVLRRNNDLARDGYHFGYNTSKEIANNFFKKYEDVKKTLNT